MAGGNVRSSGLSGTAEGKRHIRDLIDKLLKGEIGRDIATATFMRLNTLARFLELERRIREQDEVLERIEALEELEEQRRGTEGYGYGAS